MRYRLKSNLFEQVTESQLDFDLYFASVKLKLAEFEVEYCITGSPLTPPHKQVGKVLLHVQELEDTTMKVLNRRTITLYGISVIQLKEIFKSN